MELVSTNRDGYEEVVRFFVSIFVCSYKFSVQSKFGIHLGGLKSHIINLTARRKMNIDKWDVKYHSSLKNENAEEEKHRKWFRLFESNIYCFVFVRGVNCSGQSDRQISHVFAKYRSRLGHLWKLDSTKVAYMFSPFTKEKYNKLPTCHDMFSSLSGPIA